MRDSMSPSHWDFGVDKELEKVEARLAQMVESEEAILNEASMHVIGAGGKRLRPTIAILSYKSLGGDDMDKIVDIAAGFELIHSATLVHDDINDGGQMRRGRETVYRKYGLHNAIVTNSQRLRTTGRGRDPAEPFPAHTRPRHRSLCQNHGTEDR